MLNDSYLFEDIKLSVQSLPSKLNFKIGEAAKLLGVQTHVLRYWEEEFPLLKPQKFHNNQRLYFKKDMEILFLIKALLYEEQLTVKGARKHLLQCYRYWNEQKVSCKKEENHQLKTKKRLEDILKEISALKHKIDDK